MEEVRRVVIANNWKDGQIYTIIAAYLKEVAANYYEKVRANIQ